MPYISEMLNNRITDSADLVVGRLSDILIKKDNQVFPPLEFVEIQTANGKTKFISYDQVSNFSNKAMSLKNIFDKVALDALPLGPENYVYLKKNILDRQIVDIAGTRVVRVNDLRIGNFQDRICVLGIDAGLLSLLRRIGVGDLGLSGFFPARLIDWRQAEFLDSTHALQLNTAVENLSHLHPADLANVVEELSIKQAGQLLTSLEAGEAAKVLEEVDPELQTILVQHLGPDRAGKILSQMSSDEFTDLVKTFSEPEAREFLSKVSGGVVQSVKKLISYEDNTAGGLMTVDFFTARPSWTTEKTTEELRKISDRFRSIVHVYVTDEDGKFKGVVSLRRLLLADKNTLMSKMSKVFPSHSVLKPNDKLKKVTKLMTKYNLYTAAVVDKDKKLVGIVTIDDVMRLLDPDA